MNMCTCPVLANLHVSKFVFIRVRPHLPLCHTTLHVSKFVFIRVRSHLPLCHTTLHVSKFVFIRVRPHCHCAIPLYTFQNLSSSECAHTCTVPYHFTRFKICFHQSAPTLALCHTTLHVSKFVFIRVRSHLHCAIPLYTFQICIHQSALTLATVPYHFTRFKICTHQSVLTLATVTYHFASKAPTPSYASTTCTSPCIISYILRTKNTRTYHCAIPLCLVDDSKLSLTCKYEISRYLHAYSCTVRRDAYVSCTGHTCTDTCLCAEGCTCVSSSGHTCADTCLCTKGCTC